MRIGCDEPGPIAPELQDPNAPNLRLPPVRAFEPPVEDVFYAEFRPDGSGDFSPTGMPEQSIPEQPGLPTGEPDGLEEAALLLPSVEAVSF